ncbi:MAG: hypothetical protein P4M14_07630 [Gammaproteobacteria bacterium]|nr:hypothetical protein [Gammaproteobacteria bacterium]
MQSTHDEQPDNEVYYCIHSTSYDLNKDPKQIIGPGLQLANELMRNVILFDPFFGDQNNERKHPVYLFKSLEDANRYLGSASGLGAGYLGNTYGVFEVRCAPSKRTAIDKEDQRNGLLTGIGNPTPDAIVREYKDVTILNGRLGYKEGGIFRWFEDIWNGFITQAGVENKLAKLEDNDLKQLFQSSINDVASLPLEEFANDPLRRNACDAVQTQSYLLIQEILQTALSKNKPLSNDDKEHIKKQIEHVHTGVKLSKLALKDDATKEDIQALETFASKKAPGKSARWAVWTNVLVFVGAVALIAAGVATLGAAAIAYGALAVCFSAFLGYQSSKKSGLSKALDQLSVRAKKRNSENLSDDEPIPNRENMERKGNLNP